MEIYSTAFIIREMQIIMIHHLIPIKLATHFSGPWLTPSEAPTLLKLNNMESNSHTFLKPTYTTVALLTPKHQQSRLLRQS
jgi:hypothetical protein